MEEFPFFKMVASGNDFVVVDNRKGVIRDPASLAQEVCPRHTGIGADGILLIEKVGAGLKPSPAGKADYQVRIFNADGSEAEACGNGFRCVALFAHKKLGFPKKQRFEVSSGEVEAKIQGSRICVRLPETSSLKDQEKIQVNGRDLRYFFINTGVPHVVIFAEGIDRIPISEMGRAIRFHSRFKPAGTNVNFVEMKGGHTIDVRTYERGVEAETLACGTGSTAAAIVSARAGYVEAPVQVKTRGGEVLSVDFRLKGNQVRDIFLEGEAKFVFEGKWRQ